MKPKHPIQREIERAIRSQHKEQSTADAYWGWVRRYLDFCKSRGIGKSVKAEHAVTQFLSELANVHDVSANTQNQAFAALCYFYGTVRNRPLIGVNACRAKRDDAIRSILNRDELVKMFDSLSGVPLLVSRMMYASGFRIGELGKLRIKDIDFERCQIQICRSKHGKTRVVGFPECLHEHVARQIESMRVLHAADSADKLNGVSLPDAYGRKCPSARMDFGWWYLFTADQYSPCPSTGNLYRHHRDMDHIARQIKQACKDAGITKKITSHCLRHTYCTHSIESGVPLHFVQQIMGHDSLETTQIYAHASINGATSAKSPLESLLSNPQSVVEHRTESQAKPVLRILAG